MPVTRTSGNPSATSSSTELDKGHGGVVTWLFKAEIWAKLHFLFLLIYSVINHLFTSSVQPEPYMDEIFHVPQTQKYCDWKFTDWDNKITTLPGLYVVCSGILISLGYTFECSTLALRTINLVISMLTFWVLYYLLESKLPKEMPKKRRAFMAYVLTLFPVHYFFSFLYYTDQLSTLLVLLMQLFMTKNQFVKSALCGFYAVFTRQTNIIWVFWTGISVTWQLLGDDITKWMKAVLTEHGTKPTAKGKKSGKKERSVRVTLETTIQFWSGCVVKMGPAVMPYALVVTAFGLFVYMNGGIVVGDRAAHLASINIPQIFYFSFFVGTLLFPLILLSARQTMGFIRQRLTLFLGLTILGLIVVHFNTVVHPYLLADNRHYAFYIWKRVYEWYPLTRYALVPFYVATWFWIWKNTKLSSVLMLGFFVCICGNLIPQKLLEYRYFIVPYYLLRLELKYFEWKHLIPELTIYIVINCFTIYQFLGHPFVWEHEPTQTQRFMW